MANEQDYIDLGLSCANVCKALEQGMDGKTINDLSESAYDAINQLTTWVELATRISCSSTYHCRDHRTVEAIQERVLKRSRISRIFYLRDEKDAIVAWKSDLSRILQVFNVCSTRFYFITANHSIFRPSWL